MSLSWKAIVALVVTGVVALVAFIIIMVKLTQIPPGHVGISVKKCGDAKISPKPIPVGYYWRELFCEQVITYPTSMQSLILAANGKGNESITVTSSEGLNISLDVALNFTLEAAKVPSIYERWRAPINDIAHKYIRQTIREGLQLTFAKYTAEDLYSTKKETARGEVEAFLVEKLGPQGFVVQQFTLNRIDPPKQVVEAINAKVAMTQDAQRSEQEVKKREAEARQAVAKAKGEADATMARAQGEADSIRIRAEAQAKANKILAESVTPALIEYQKVQKWSGVLPTVTGGQSLPIITLK
jgi:regulator of protease activity HflC (stomatin/prohibitin superfamily)